MMLRDEIIYLKKILHKSMDTVQPGADFHKDRRQALYRLMEIRKNLELIFENGWFSEDQETIH